MNWDKLLAFYHTATLGTVKKAANKMEMSTPSISRLINGLEEEIGHDLFTVVSQRMILNKKGEHFLPAVKRLLSQYDTSVKELDQLAQQMEGHFNITSTISIVALWLFDDIAEFMKLYPQISFSFKAVDETPDLTLGESDIDIRPFSQKEEGIEYKYLTTHDMGLYATREYIQKSGLPEKISDFENHDLLAFPSEHLLVRHTSLNWHLLHINSWKKLIPVGSYLGILRAVENSLGIGPISHVAAKISRVPLIPILPDILTHPMDIYYRYPTALSENRVITELYNYLRERPEGPLKGRIRM